MELDCLGALAEMVRQYQFKRNWHYFDMDCKLKENGRLNIILTHIKQSYCDHSYQPTFNVPLFTKLPCVHVRNPDMSLKVPRYQLNGFRRNGCKSHSTSLSAILWKLVFSNLWYIPSSSGEVSCLSTRLQLFCLAPRS